MTIWFDKLVMKKASEQNTWLHAFHWEELANLHVDVGCLRHQFIQAINAKVATRAVAEVDLLAQLATIDDLLQGADRQLNQAKRALFDFCYERGDAHPEG
jgi:hypothetical protein